MRNGTVIVPVALAVSAFLFSTQAGAEDIGCQFQRRTSLPALLTETYTAPTEGWVMSQKRYEAAETVSLPVPSGQISGADLVAVINKRRSIREYTARPISLQELSDLLFLGSGVTDKKPYISLRSAPSAGASYPIEIYVVANAVAGLEKGFYHYVPEEHLLEVIRKGDFAVQLKELCLGQAFVKDASAIILMSGVFPRVCARYGNRGYRYVYMEAGHIAQNLYLGATALDLGSCVIGAFLDDEMNLFCGLDGEEESIIYIHCIGTARELKG